MVQIKKSNPGRLALARAIIRSWERGTLDGASPYELRGLLENEIAQIAKERDADPELADALISDCRRILKRIAARVN